MDGHVEFWGGIGMITGLAVARTGESPQESSDQAAAIPSAAKARLIAGDYGVAEATPFQNTSCSEVP
jgi:hypothetical protein